MSITEARAADAHKAAADAIANGGVTWLTRPQVAERLQVPTQTLATWASKKVGPKFSKMGRHTRYRLSDVVAWENDQATGGAA